MFSLMWVKVAIGAVAVIGLLQLHHWWNTRDIKRDLASTQEQLKTTQEAALEAAKEAARNSEREEANRKDQQAAIEKQNQRIAASAARVREVEANAALTAFRVAEEGRLIAAALRDRSSTVPEGPEGLNVWLTQRFATPGVTK